MNGRRFFQSNKEISNRGTTLVEMIVCFALLSIFVTAAAVVISSVTNLYYQVKGETYSRQVADILMEKVVSEIEGAKWYGDELGNPVISECEVGSSDNSITLYDHTDTLVSLYRGGEDELLIEYAPISRTNYEREATIWRFDKAVYNHYRLESLNFVYGNELGSAAEKYGVNPLDYGITSETYGKNIVVVFMTISSPRYGTYRTVRPVRIFNAG